MDIRRLLSPFQGSRHVPSFTPGCASLARVYSLDAAPRRKIQFLLTTYKALVKDLRRSDSSMAIDLVFSDDSGYRNRKAAAARNARPA